MHQNDAACIACKLSSIRLALMVTQERLVKREAPPAATEEDVPAMSEEASAAENASSQMAAAVEAAGASNEAQTAFSCSPEEKAAAVRPKP